MKMSWNGTWRWDYDASALTSNPLRGQVNYIDYLITAATGASEQSDLKSYAYISQEKWATLKMPKCDD